MNFGLEDMRNGTILGTPVEELKEEADRLKESIQKQLGKKDGTVKYKLELTEEQAKLVSNACDLYCRIGLGQFDRIVEFCMDKEFIGRTEKMSDEEFHDWLDRRDKAENKMYEAREFIFPKLQGKLHTYGIGHDTESNMAYNIHQVLRYHVGNDERKPFAVYGELPKIEVVEE